MSLVAFVTGYNIADVLPRCLRTIEQQTNQDYQVIMVDDASTDDTAGLMEDFTWQNAKGWVVMNGRNMKKAFNLFNYAREGDPNDVIVMIDGDDFLAHDGVFRLLDEIYADPDLWLTYGSYGRVPDPLYMPNPARVYEPEVIAARDFRRAPFCHNHLRTFRRFLLQELDERDFQDDDGQWFTCGDDHAFMVPFLEMSTDHFRFIQEVLYVYNEGNPESDAKIRAPGLAMVHDVIRRRAVRPTLVRST